MVLISGAPMILEAFEFFAGVSGRVMQKIPSAFAYKTFPPQAVRTVRNFLAAAPNELSNFWIFSRGGAIARVAPDAAAFFNRQPLFYLEWEADWENCDPFHL
jgi:hypothetical protein